VNVGQHMRSLLMLDIISSDLVVVGYVCLLIDLLLLCEKLLSNLLRTTSTLDT
jgi:hypothetical protein